LIPMLRKRFTWKLSHGELALGDSTLIVGILSLAPESSGRGRVLDAERGYAAALQLEQAGADIVDLSAESFRPGSKRIEEAEEVHRLIPVLKLLRGKLTVPLAVSTWKSGIVDRALGLGAQIINDPSGLTLDAQLARTVARHDAGLVLTHMRGAPDEWQRLPPVADPVGMIHQELSAAVNRARRAGLTVQQMVVDPGLGMGKRKEENMLVLARIGLLKSLELPLMVGPSRKLFLGQATPEALDSATAAAVTAAILGGAHLVRVHDVARIRPVASVADAILRSSAAG